MGFFRDVAKLTKQAKEIDKTFDPGAQMRAGTERMKAMNESMAAAATALTTGIPAKAQIVSVGMTAGSMNADPIMPVNLLVMQDGHPPRPVSVSATVPMSQTYRMIPGTMVAVRISETDPDLGIRLGDILVDVRIGKTRKGRIRSIENHFGLVGFGKCQDLIGDFFDFVWTEHDGSCVQVDR